MLNFEHVEIKDFNRKYGLNIPIEWEDNGDFYENLLQVIEDSSIRLFSASFDRKDVVEDILDCNGKFNFTLLEIENIYIAIY